MQAFIVDSLEASRLDIFLASKTGHSRSKIVKAIECGCVTLDGLAVKKPSTAISPESKIIIDEEFFVPKAKPKSTYEPTIVFEDDDIVVIDKPSGLVVHDADGVKESTVVDFFKARQTPLAPICGENREGIVHRLDKETSGLMVIAKNDNSALYLKECIAAKDTNKLYLALIDAPLKQDTLVDAAISRDSKNRVRMKAGTLGKESRSAFFKLATSRDDKCELVLVKLLSGRTHQIRAHLAMLGRHILGDDLYGFKSRNANISPTRVALHAYILQITHPNSFGKLHFCSKPTGEFEKIIKESFDKEKIDEVFDMEYVLSLANGDIDRMFVVKPGGGR